MVIDKSNLTKKNLRGLSINSLLFQKSYKTIESVKGNKYVLRFPNNEVQSALL